MVTGFRFAYGGAQEYYGVIPDICTLGKAVAGGFPLTAVAGKSDLMNHFDSDRVVQEDFMPHIGTLSGNPVACAAGLAVLEILRRPGAYQKMFEIGKELMTGLQEAFDQVKVPAKVIGEPVLFDVFFTREEIYDYRTSIRGDREMLKRFNSLMLANGIFKGASKFYFSTEHDQSDIQATIKGFQSASGRLSDGLF